MGQKGDQFPNIILYLILIFLNLFNCNSAVSQPPIINNTVSANDFGGIGLLQNRTARFGSSGSFEAGTTFIDPYRRWYLRLNLFPWLEGTFRYTDIRNRLFSNIVEFSGTQTFKDRGADIKFRLWPESRYVPQIAVGMQDGLGTGIFRGEYLVATKRYLDLDLSLGLGWGYLANGGTWENPLTSLSEALRSRSTASGTGGTPLLGSWFSGEFVAPFFGVEYQTPFRGVTIKAEYNLNDYQSEPQGNVLEKSLSPWNVGLNYRPYPWVDISLAWERGHSYMSRFAILADLNDPGMPKLDPPPPLIKIRNSKSLLPEKRTTEAYSIPAFTPRSIIKNRLTSEGSESTHQIDKIFSSLEQAGLQIKQFDLTHKEVHVHLAKGSYSLIANNAEDLASVIVANLPTLVERVSFVDHSQKNPKISVIISQKDIERNRIVDFLFDGLESEGIHPHSFHLDHDSATLIVPTDPAAAGFDRNAEIRAAQAVLRASPTPVKSVTIITAKNELVERRVTFDRSEINRQIAVDHLFENVEADGVQIESFEMSRGKATVYVMPEPTRYSHDLTQTAHKLANGIPIDLEEINLINLNRDIEETAVTLRKDENQWNLVTTASGTSKHIEVVKDRKNKIANSLFDALNKEGFKAEGVDIKSKSATIYLASRKFRQFARNVGYVARIATGIFPDNIEELTIVSLQAGMEMNRVTIWRKDLENFQLAQGSVEEVLTRSNIKGPLPGSSQGIIKNPDRYPSLKWGIGPSFRQHIGGSSKFVLFQIWARLNATLEVMPGLSFRGRYGRDIYNNFHRIRQDSDSVLTRVRSDIKEYLQQGENALVVLQGDYVFSPSRDFYTRISAGLFEEMYGGISSEVLYRPFNSRVAIGAEFNYVRQREFDVKLKFREFATGTGHVNAYYQWPQYNLVTSVHIGEYLAGDRGGTFIMSRGFDSGVRMGSWFTLTNVPFEEFGEGSFDKGIFVSIPFELFLLKSTPSHGRMGFRPLTRDGGQMLDVSTRLYDLTSDANLGRVVDDWGRLLD